MTTGILSDTDPLMRTLRSLAQESSHLRGLVRLYEVVLPILRDAEVHAGPFSLTREQAQSKMAMGLPLLHDLELEFDNETMRGLVIQLARAVEKFGEGAQGDNGMVQASSARRFREALEERKLDVSALLTGVAAGDKNLVISMSDRLQLDASLVWTLGQNALKPLLRVLCVQLASIADEVPWQKGYCFVCGADAALGELQGNAQAKHLRCGQCGADWPFRRLECMYCGNEDHNTLGLLYAENGREKMRVEVCNKCHGYLKVISAFSPTPTEMLHVEDLATLHLDHIAEERGYTRRVTYGVL